MLLRGILTVGMKFGPRRRALPRPTGSPGWDSKNKGRIWKLDTPATAGSEPDARGSAARSSRRTSRHASGRRTCRRCCAHVDMRVRQKAQFELVRRGDAQTLAGGGEGPGAHQLGAHPRRSGASRSWRARARTARSTPRSYAAPDRRRRRDPRAGGEDARRHALRRGGAGVWCRCSATRRRVRGSSPPKRSAASAYKPAAARDRRDARRQRRQGRVPAPRRQPRALAHRRRGGARRAVDASVAGRADRRDHRAAPAAQRRGRAVPHRQRRR